MRITQLDGRKPPKRDPSNTCLTDCVARYFRMDPKKVPFFIGNVQWLRSLTTFFRRKGYVVEVKMFSWSKLSNKKKLYLVQGLSPRSIVKGSAKIKKRTTGLQHAVLYRGKEPFFDPNGGGKFLKGDPIFLFDIKKLPILKRSALPPRKNKNSMASAKKAAPMKKTPAKKVAPKKK